MFYNKWVDFKKGLIGLGELVEEFFVQIALPNNYNPDIAATEIFKRVIADVQTAIYRINVKTFYKRRSTAHCWRWPSQRKVGWPI